MIKFRMIASIVFMLTIFTNYIALAQQTLENNVLTNKVLTKQLSDNERNKNIMVDPANNTIDNIAAEKDIEEKEESNLDRHHDSRN